MSEIPKVDGEGYLPGEPKIFYMSGPDAYPGTPFEITDPSTGRVVYTGRLADSYVDDTASTGERVLSGDFSKFSVSGSYELSVGDSFSAPFRIGDDVYLGLYHDAARTFSLNRCGAPIDDPITGLHHVACHMNDIYIKGQAATGDFTGGWHNAGDYGKWTHTTAIAASFLMWLQTLGPGAVHTEQLDIAEAQHGTPDVLSLARWGLEWLLKMQQPDGSVFHKVDSEPNFAAGVPPEDDPNKRYAADASTIDAADFTAVMAQASRVYAPFDIVFSRKCGDAADKSWAWVVAHPNVPETDPYYPDSDPSQEVFWAQAEMARRLSANGSAGVVDLLNTLTTRMTSATPGRLTWSNPEAFGWLTLRDDTELPADIRDRAGRGLEALGSAIEAKAAQTGYGVALLPPDYVWGSNENLLCDAATLLFAWHVNDKLSYRDCAIEQLHYILGRNSLCKSFVTGHGAYPIQTPYHWTMLAEHLYMPGWATGGPNAQQKGVDEPLLEVIKAGTPPAKCFLDRAASDGSWASNEGTISEEGALVFVSGMLLPEIVTKAERANEQDQQ